MLIQVTGAVAMCCCAVFYGLWQAGRVGGESDSVVSRIGKLPKQWVLIPFVGVLASYWILSILTPKPLNAVTFALVPALVAFVLGLAAARKRGRAARS
ncbi:MAG: hypothetical protein LBJ02_10715 [Bifidobacteriaceae bacterium]|jgi:hypothetical protein|nr:hypothetical protein [Bifidobacteriaceae bacterium]